MLIQFYQHTSWAKLGPRWTLFGSGQKLTRQHLQAGSPVVVETQMLSQTETSRDKPSQHVYWKSATESSMAVMNNVKDIEVSNRIQKQLFANHQQTSKKKKKMKKQNQVP